jgi:tRNA (mo5U34)-methyltransferase
LTESVTAAEVASLGWYHTFELPGGVVTKGLFDLRKLPAKLPIPASLEGKRCLDAAASDGFWSFELARRGASEVVSVDLDDTNEQDIQGAAVAKDEGRAARAFHLVRQATGTTNVKRVNLNVYDMSPEVLGTFDYVFMGNILLHLADPARAVRAVNSVLRPTGEFLSFETVSLPLSALSRRRALASLEQRDFPRWWTPNMAGHRRLLQAGGFEVLDYGGPVFQPMGSWRPRFPRKRPRTFVQWHFWLFARQLGVTSAWARCRPLPTA